MNFDKYLFFVNLSNKTTDVLTYNRNRISTIRGREQCSWTVARDPRNGIKLPYISIQFSPQYKI